MDTIDENIGDNRRKRVRKPSERLNLKALSNFKNTMDSPLDVEAEQIRIAEENRVREMNIQKKMQKAKERKEKRALKMKSRCDNEPEVAYKKRNTSEGCSVMNILQCSVMKKYGSKLKAPDVNSFSPAADLTMMQDSPVPPHDQINTESKSAGDEEDQRLLQSQSQSPLPLSTDNNPKHNYVSDEEEEVAYDSQDKIIIDGLDSDSDNTTDFNSTPPFSWKKLWLFTGPGFLMSIAFLDPGNLEGDLQAGAIAGYSLLWLLMWATGMGLLIQLLSARVGVATGRHLSELCREEYPKWAGLLLWFMAEVALIGADIQEVIGSAIAIQILSNGILPIWAGVVITASDCFMFLLLENYGVRNLEAVFAVLISTMGLSFAWMFADAQPSGKELLIGLLVPKLSSRTIRQAVGVVGCVIMPHNVFLHSALVQSRKIDPKKKGRVQEAINYYTIESSIALFVSFMINLFVTTVFAKGFYGTKQADSIGLVNAGQYLEKKYGGGFMPVLYIWGIGLLAAGQSSTITGTYAGQFIMGGFLNLRLKKWLRALITRSCAIVPTMIVALVFNKSEASLDVLNEWLNVLQSIQIPFALIPLLTLVTKEEVMGVFKIGPTLERIAWSVAALVMVINGYLLLDFFVAEVNGFLFGALAITATSAYVIFILYLISHGDCLPSTWFSHIVNKGYSYIGK